MGYALSSLLVGAALAPWLFGAAKAFVQWIEDLSLTETLGFHYLHHHLDKADFTRVFNRAVLVAALLGLYPAMRALAIKPRELRLSPNPRAVSDVVWGFALAAGLLLAMGAVYVQADLFNMRDEIAWGKVWRNSITRALGAGVIEEWFFRGALLGLLLRAGSERGALVFLTTLFAAVHFLQAPPEVEIHEGVEAGTGFWLLGQIFSAYARANFLLAEFATLWLAGWILGWARLRTRSLWLSIGLHAGWIFGIGFFAGMTRASKAVRREEWLPWVGETLKSGLVPLAVLALTGVAVWWWVTRSRQTEAAGAEPAT